jgi:hypothetical protein
VEYDMSVSEGGGTATLVTSLETVDAVMCPVSAQHGQGAATGGTQLQSSRLVLFLVVNAFIAGTAAAVLLAVFELVMHFLP